MFCYLCLCLQHVKSREDGRAEFGGRVLSGSVPHSQSVHKRYVNILNFCEMLSVSPLRAQNNGGEGGADQSKGRRASACLAQSRGLTFGLTSALSLVLRIADPRGAAVGSHTSKPTQFAGPLRFFESTKLVKRPYFMVACFRLHL